MTDIIASRSFPGTFASSFQTRGSTSRCQSSFNIVYGKHLAGFHVLSRPQKCSLHIRSHRYFTTSLSPRSQKILVLLARDNNEIICAACYPPRDGDRIHGLHYTILIRFSIKAEVLELPRVGCVYILREFH